MGLFSENRFGRQNKEQYYNYKKDIITSQTLLTSYLVQLIDDDFSVKAEIYDTNLLNSERLKLLYDNAGITPIYMETETDKCARLQIIDATTGKLVEDVSFICDNTENLDIFSIKKAI